MYKFLQERDAVCNGDGTSDTTTATVSDDFPMIHASASAPPPLVCSIYEYRYSAQRKNLVFVPILALPSASVLSATPEISAYLVRSYSFSCFWSKRVIWVAICSLI